MKTGQGIGKNAVENNYFAVDSMPLGITESEKIELVAKQLFDRKAEGQAIIDSWVESIESIIHLDQTIKDLAYAITNPNEIIDKIVLSVEELDNTLDYAMKNDPALAGEILGYIGSSITGIPGTSIVLGGAAAKVVQKAAYLAKASGVTVIDQVNRFKNYSILNQVINEVDNISYFNK